MRFFFIFAGDILQLTFDLGGHVARGGMRFNAAVSVWPVTSIGHRGTSLTMSLLLEGQRSHADLRGSLADVWRPTGGGTVNLQRGHGKFSSTEAELSGLFVVFEVVELTTACSVTVHQNKKY